MKNIIILISFIVLTSCSSPQAPTYPKTEKIKPEHTQPNNWESLNFPNDDISNKYSNVMLHLTINSSNDLIASGNSNKLYIFWHEDKKWRVIKKYYNFISFVYSDYSDNIFVGISSLGMFGSYVETPDNEGKTWKTVFGSQNPINNLKSYNGSLYLTRYGGVNYSLDGGKTWEKLTSNFEQTDVRDIAVNPKTGSIFITTGKEIFKSVDNGKTWLNTAPNNQGFSLIRQCNNGYIFALSDKMYLTKNDGKKWEEVSIGSADTQIWDVAVSAHDFIVVGTLKDGIYLSKDYGDTWTNIGLKNNKIYSLCFNSKDYIYAGTEFNGIFKSKQRINK